MKRLDVFFLENWLLIRVLGFVLFNGGVAIGFLSVSVIEYCLEMLLTIIVRIIDLILFTSRVTLGCCFLNDILLLTATAARLRCY